MCTPLEVYVLQTWALYVHVGMSDELDPCMFVTGQLPELPEVHIIIIQIHAHTYMFCYFFIDELLN